ncbi:hypothetical protein AOL_s00043g441 [Orbilia oligospora ATCC 24927]|uniref:Uncharacterized protein n=2 Tax=Orbilia oligospora TaxID=2813651 RepID=G1X417_ARTOA|nr:hypothetical protein AOL_s00043g441 [Orbilia oligospora ATCC 24927]EGX52051.1 hypothetical protein AOL_s00043g441 [Orbilia oligospora ATCC 24927]KAF3289541.1 hypothetical protein TWF970_003312 [Orbilia oligospora]
MPAQTRLISQESRNRTPTHCFPYVVAPLSWTGSCDSQARDTKPKRTTASQLLGLKGICSLHIFTMAGTLASEVQRHKSHTEQLPPNSNAFTDAYISLIYGP